MEHWITTQEAAAIIGCGKRHVNKLCEKGDLHCQRFGRVRQVDKASAKEYARTPHPSGPKGPIVRRDEYGWAQQ
jgi:excisionase family DNA binding protein